MAFSVAGRLRLEDKQQRAGLPAVGDWVALRKPGSGSGPWMVQEILPRRSAFWRKMAGTAHKTQVVAANMDIIFVTSSLNRDFNPRRLERYLAMAGESGAQPVIILTKTDLAGDELEGYVEEAEGLDQTTPVHAVSVVTGEGLADLNAYLKPGIVVALLGSSGVGKSTLINHWLGEERLRVNELRNDDRGRHTTTHRELIRLPGGALVIDTPGMREVTLMDHGEGLDEAFEDIQELSEQCKFSDCQHSNEPGCAIRQAIEDEKLDEDRLDHYRLLRKEVEEAEQKRLEMTRRRQSRGGRRRTR
jgi:ribosome biogenesis GTPase